MKKIILFIFSYKGRINRTTYWLYHCCLFSGASFVFIIGDILARIIGENAFYIFTPIVGIVFLIFGYSIVPMHVKRFHDTNRSGWACFMTFIPLIGIFYIFVVCGCLSGTKGKNNYGERSDIGIKIKNKWFRPVAAVLFLSIAVSFGSYMDYSDQKTIEEILDGGRVAVFQSMISSTENIDGKLMYRLTDLGKDLLSIFYEDTKKQPALNFTTIETYSYKIPQTGFIDRVRAFTYVDDATNQHYVDEIGFEILLLYGVCRAISEFDFYRLASASNWYNGEWNSTDCFFIYDRLLSE